MTRCAALITYTRAAVYLFIFFKNILKETNNDRDAILSY